MPEEVDERLTEPRSSKPADPRQGQITRRRRLHSKQSGFEYGLIGPVGQCTSPSSPFYLIDRLSEHVHKITAAEIASIKGCTGFRIWSTLRFRNPVHPENRCKYLSTS